MLSKKLLFSVILSLMCLIYVYPQDEDTTEATNDKPERHRHHNFRDFRFDVFNDEFNGTPTAAIDYGLSQTNIKDFNETFAKPNLIEVKLGYTHQNSAFENENILKYNFKYFYVSNISVDLNNNSIGINDLRTDLWRFGFGRAEGYGYKLGVAAIIPYHSYSFEWSKLRMEDTPRSFADKNTTDLFTDTFRFGNSTEAGIKFQLIPNIALDAGYQRSIIFPRHVFWAWAGGVVIEIIGQSAVDHFVNEVMDSSPYAAPIVSFILKNALSYGLYELRQDKMNWPFDTVPPLAYDQFKFGITFVL